MKKKRKTTEERKYREKQKDEETCIILKRGDKNKSKTGIKERNIREKDD
jgi:hypothetical protein